MLSFATEFPVLATQTAAPFLHACAKWLLESPHTCLTAEQLAMMETQGTIALSRGSERLNTTLVTEKERELAGLRYERNDGDLIWLSTVTFARMAGACWTSIRVSCESTHPAVNLPPAKKPVVVRVLLNELRGGLDGSLHTSHAPLMLGNGDIEAAAQMIRGESGCYLPIVYVSSPFHGNQAVNSTKLAVRVSGMAHVVVEPNREFARRLQLSVESQNVYGGTVGVYWPDGAGRRSFFIGRQYETSQDVEAAVYEEIRSALINRRPLPQCTWSSIEEANSRQLVAALRADGSLELDAYVAAFDREIAALRSQLDDANRETGRLQAELRRHERRNSVGTGLMLRTATEQDLYPGEMSAIVSQAIAESVARVPADSRRAHVLAAIAKDNPGDQNLTQFREELKQLLRGFRTLDPQIRRGLEDMGFSITEDGKHCKLVFRDDERYTFALPKSGSDSRGGLNAASDIGRLLF